MNRLNGAPCITRLAVALAMATCALATTDLLIYGATPAGIAAALAAARFRPTASILIVEPTKQIGGMSSPGGIGLRDIGSIPTINGSMLAWAMLNAEYYHVDYPVWQPDNHVGEQNFWRLLNAQSNVQTRLSCSLVRDSLSSTVNVTETGLRVHRTRSEHVTVHDGRVTALQVRCNGSSTTETLTAETFIDASYEGDLAIGAGVSYTWGREPRSAYNEVLAGVQQKTPYGQFVHQVNASDSQGQLLPGVAPGTLGEVGSGDDGMMGYSFRLCTTTNTSNQVPYPRPPQYNAADFALLANFIEAAKQAKTNPNMPFGTLNYRSYPPSNKYDICDSGAGITTDLAGGNTGYVNGSDSERLEIKARHHYYVMGMMYYLATEPNVPDSMRRVVETHKLCKDEWPLNGHIPLQLYVREGTRIVGERVMTQNDVFGGKCLNNSIGVGSWGYDIHVIQRKAVVGSHGVHVAYNEGSTAPGTPISGHQKEFDLPYTLLTPKRNEVENLLVPVCSASTHVTFAGIREEPTLMQLGAAAGVASLVAQESRVAVQSVSVETVQRALLQQHFFVHWPARDNCSVVPPSGLHDGDVFAALCNPTTRVQQKWSFHSADGTVRQSANASVCLSVENSRAGVGGHGQAIVARACDAALRNDQKWSFKQTAQGHEIVSVEPRACLNYAGTCSCVNIINEAAATELWQCGGGGTDDVWAFDSHVGTISSVTSSRCLDVYTSR